VNAVLEAKKKNPDWGWKPLFEQARKVLKLGRMSSGIDHPNKLTWIKPMLGIEENTKSKNRKESPTMLTEIEKSSKNTERNKFQPKFSAEEKMTFAKAFFEFRKNNPGLGNLHAIRAARETMPEHKRMCKHIDSVKQIPWIIPLIEQLENPPKAPSRFDCKLSDKEKEQFTDIVYKLRKGGATGAHCMREANSFMPEGHKLASVHPSGVPWLMRALAKLDEADKSKIVIDHRNTLPKPPEEIPEIQRERKHSTTKTYWNEEDKQLFAEVAYQLKMCNPGWGWQQILDMANKEMPGHKQRPKMPPSPSQIPWLSPMFDEIAKRPAEKYVPEPEPVAPVAAPQPVTAQPMDMQALMMAAFEKIAREQLALGTMNIPTAINGTVQPEKIEKPQKKKVVVVGLLAVQTNDIQKRFGHKFDLKFIGSNTPNQQIRDAMKNADVGILMTRFVSHPTQAAMRSHPGFTFCNGNSTALENLLEEKIVSLGIGQ